MSEQAKVPESGRRWEVERDRFGYFCHPDLDVGECVKVMPVAEHEDALAALRWVVEHCCCQPSGQHCGRCLPAALALLAPGESL